jgi:hypothetical protein
MVTGDVVGVGVRGVVVGGVTMGFVQPATRIRAMHRIMRERNAFIQNTITDRH